MTIWKRIVRPGGRGPSRRRRAFLFDRSMGGDFFLQPELLTLQLLNHRHIGRGPRLFLSQFSFQAGMLGTKGIDMGCLHRAISFQGRKAVTASTRPCGASRAMQMKHTDLNLVTPHIAKMAELSDLTGEPSGSVMGISR